MTTILIITINEIDKHIHLFLLIYRPKYNHVESKAALYVRIRTRYRHVIVNNNICVSEIRVPQLWQAEMAVQGGVGLLWGALGNHFT